MRTQLDLLKEKVAELPEKLELLHVPDYTHSSVDSNKDINKLEHILESLKEEWDEKIKILEKEKQQIFDNYSQNKEQ